MRWNALFVVPRVVVLCLPWPCSRVVAALACLTLSRLSPIMLLDSPELTVELCQ
jgi:hypothetical protein